LYEPPGEAKDQEAGRRFSARKASNHRQKSFPESTENLLKTERRRSRNLLQNVLATEFQVFKGFSNQKAGKKDPRIQIYGSVGNCSSVNIVKGLGPKKSTIHVAVLMLRQRAMIRKPPSKHRQDQE